MGRLDIVVSRDQIAPSVPGQPAQGAVTQNSITISWSASTDTGGSGLKGYDVERNGAVIAIDVPTTSYVDTGLSSGATYTYRVRARDNAGNVSAFSTARSVTTADTTAPTVPVISAAALSSSELQVSLVTPSTDIGSGLRDYTLQVSSTGTSGWSDLATGLQAGSFPYTHGGLTASTQRFYRLRAFDIATNFSTSSVVNATTLATGLNWIGGNDTTTDVNATVGTPVDFDVAAQVVGEQSIALVSGSVPGLTYNPSTMRITGTPTTANAPTGANLVFDADDGQGGGDAAADWAARIAGSGVVWYHGFASDAEVDAFRWSSGYSGGNDPLAVGVPLAGNVQRLAGEGPGGMDCLQITRPAGTNEVASHWWRPFSPIVGSGNGRGQDDPGADGTLTPQSYAATDGGSQIANWGQRGFYGHSSYHGSGVFDGTEYYLQMRVKMDPRRAQSGMPTVGKLSFQTVTYISYVNQEIVTYSGGQHPAIPTQNNFAMYQGWNYTPMWDSSVGGGGSASNRQPGNQLGACNPAANPNTCWAWSGGWDTVLYHVVPGRHGVDEQIIQVYAAHEGETVYTRIWDDVYTARFDSSYPYGYNALILSTYNNGNNCPSEFWHRWAQVIFSHEFIPCPQV